MKESITSEEKTQIILFFRKYWGITESEATDNELLKETSKTFTYASLLLNIRSAKLINELKKSLHKIFSQITEVFRNKK